MLNLLPVFLDHVLRPTLTDPQFAMEVYHLDADANGQGVVYSEMAGREHSQSDLLDRSLRKLMYNDSTYANECGGLTPEIERLSNDEIKVYHKEWYSTDRVTLILAGAVPTEEELRVQLEPLFGTSPPAFKHSVPQPFQEVIGPAFSEGKPAAFSRVQYPSPDLDTCSLSVGFVLPRDFTDYDKVALDILGRYLCEDPSSILGSWTTLEKPRCEDISWQVSDQPAVGRASFEFSFSGIPNKDMEAGLDTEEDGSEGDEHEGEEEEDEDEDGEEDEEGSEDGEGSEEGSWSDVASDEADDDGGDDDDQASETRSGDIQMEDVDGAGDEVEGRASRAPPEPAEDLLETIPTYLHQALAPLLGPDSPLTHENLLPTIDRERRKVLEELEDDPANLLGERCLMAVLTGSSDSRIQEEVDVIDEVKKVSELSKKDPDYWKNIIRRALWETPCMVAATEPSVELAKEQREATEAARKKRAEELGPAGLEELGRKAAEAKKACAINLPPELVDKMPPVPSIRDLPSIPCSCSIVPLEGSFVAAILASTTTAFAGARFYFDTSALKPKTRFFLPLLSELLFTLPLRDGTSWEAVSKKTMELLTAHFEGVGMSAGTFTGSWAGQFYQIGFTALADRLEEATDWTARVFLDADWDAKRIKSAARNLKARVAEYLRSGSDDAFAILRRLVCVGEDGKDWDERCGSPENANEGAIGILAQRKFLAEAAKMEPEELAEMFDELRKGLVNGPKNFVIVTSPGDEQGKAALKMVVDTWDKHATPFRDSAKTNGATKVPLPFPIKQTQFDPNRIPAPLPRSIVVPVPGLQTSTVSMLVPCSVPPGHDDYLPLLVLCNMISRADGPLYTKIRGGGWAYGADISLSAQSGALRFDVWECSDVRKAILGMWDILEGLGKGWDKHEVETAKAVVAYGMVDARSTPGEALWATICGAVRGFPSVEAELEYEAKISDVTDDDLTRVYAKYVRQLLDPEL